MLLLTLILYQGVIAAILSTHQHAEGNSETLTSREEKINSKERKNEH